MDPDRNYQPRFVDAGGEHAHTNRLAGETSPYLLQHAHNPVDWYPWGEEALELARSSDRPVFLSVGYSTCYWCHVMERECFENEAVAAEMNASFVCIKVDREERPDVDDLYMNAVQLFSNGHGGWPMSVFLEPTRLEPFFGGTYFPPHDQHGRPGFVTLLQRIAQVWATDRAPLLDQARRAGDAIRSELQVQGAPVPLDTHVVDDAVTRLLASFDSVNGGFDRAPKFPQPGRLLFLQEAAAQNAAADDAVQRTLDAMAMGGMYDQVGGGFHRYSTDERWLVPHFEKMLYDNALLAEVYAQSFESTRDPFHERVLRQTLDYVLREMTASSGRFYSAQDAEVDASEGKSYVWTRDEAVEAAGKSEAVLDALGLSGPPNFRDPHDPSAPEVYVLHLARRPEVGEFDALDQLRAALLTARDQRKQPVTDDKTLASWNGLMIAGFAEGGRVLEEPRYLAAAARAAGFVLGEMSEEGAGLSRSYRGGVASIPGYLEDHAFLAHGLLRLHRATGNQRWLTAALTVLDEAGRLFADPAGGYFDTRAGQSDLFVRLRSRYDGATPSGNSVMLLNLLEVHALTNDGRWLDAAFATLASLSRSLARFPTALTVALCGLHRIAGEWPERLAGMADGEDLTPAVVRAEASGLSEDGGFTVHLEIAEGYHINAHEPGDPGLIGLEVRLAGTDHRLELDYPEGEPFAAPYSEIPIRVHSGSVELKGRVVGAGEAPRLVLRWQACDATHCLAPAEMVLDLASDGGQSPV